MVGTKLAMDGKDALDKIVQSSDHEYRKKPKKKVGMKLSKALRMVNLRLDRGRLFKMWRPWQNFLDLFLIYMYCFI